MEIPIRVHMVREMSDHSSTWLGEELEDGIQVTIGSQVPDPPDYQILVAGRPSPEFIQASRDLQAVVIPWAGVPPVTLDVMKEFPDITLHNLHHNALPTAEIAVALLMAAAKQIVPFDRKMREHDWRPRYKTCKTWLLSGRTALIVGWGAIGEHVGRMLTGLGLRVLATRRSLPDSRDPGVEIYPADQLSTLLPRADILVLTVPHTPETTGLIGEEELTALPDGAILVNVARGPVVDQHALYAALKSGKLFAAGLDVWYSYPGKEEERAYTPPAEVPFHELENVVMSPHRGGNTRESEKLRMQHLARLLNAAARGESIPNLVNRHRGY